MRTTRLLRAYSLLGSGAALTTLISLVATKLYALTLGTEGFAQLTLLNAFLSIAVLFCATGVSTAFVREGVRSLTAAARIPYGTVRAAGHLLVFATSLALVIVTLGASDGVLDWFFDDSIGRSSLLLIAAAVFFQTAGGISLASLNAQRRLRSIVGIEALKALLLPVSIIPLALWAGPTGVAGGLLLASALGAALAAVADRRGRPALAAEPARQEATSASPTIQLRHAVLALLAASLPLAASTALGSSAQYLLPIIVLHQLDVTSVSYLRAGQGPSASYLNIFASLLSRDLYPRLCEASDEPSAMTEIVNEQQRLLMSVAAPGSIALFGCAPLLIPLLYSGEFLPAVPLFRWMVLSDLLRFYTWPLGYVLLAQGRSRAYLVAQGTLWLGTLAGSYLGAELGGLSGVGAGLLAANALHLLVQLLLIRQRVAFHYSLASGAGFLWVAAAALPLSLLASWSPGLAAPIVSASMAAGLLAVNARGVLRQILQRA